MLDNAGEGVYALGNRRMVRPEWRSALRTYSTS